MPTTWQNCKQSTKELLTRTNRWQIMRKNYSLQFCSGSLLILRAVAWLCVAHFVTTDYRAGIQFLWRVTIMELKDSGGTRWSLTHV